MYLCCHLQGLLEFYTNFPSFVNMPKSLTIHDVWPIIPVKGHHLTLIRLNNWSVSSCSIQLSSLPTTQSIFIPSVNLLIVSPTIISKLLIYRRSNQGRSTDPCGTMGTVTTATVHACPMPPSTTPILDPICQRALAPKGSFHLIDFPHPTSDLVNTLTTVHMDDINHTSLSIPFVICSWSSN